MVPIEADGICVGGMEASHRSIIYDTTHYGKKNSVKHEHLTYLDYQAPPLH